MQYQFGKTSRPDLPYQQQLAVGRKVASHFSGMLPALGICAGSQPAIEGRFHWQLAVLQQHLQQLPYLLSSSSPCIADFGLMGPLYAHLYIDPLPSYLIKCTVPLVADYIERACSIAPTSQPAGKDPIVALQPQHPQQPAEGQLHVGIIIICCLEGC
ncbi:hypothetical protein OEZ85_009072 [Tetradesmus obliquus]|uniref:GST C-terminal domain-containing protein n=1 Tax=Tetradesmus obliquus TaxID=3088 RepID=A0ABY8TKN4_TETOB|nr:hypothetical protein OEZ85_009072 [Tetradesmus obliquus]